MIPWLVMVGAITTNIINYKYDQKYSIDPKPKELECCDESS
jgi:hypothetical protein